MLVDAALHLDCMFCGRPDGVRGMVVKCTAAYCVLLFFFGGGETTGRSIYIYQRVVEALCGQGGCALTTLMHRKEKLRYITFCILYLYGNTCEIWAG